nr:MAG TPA: hypothetical protein [Caudoviricetes sp.]
MIRPLCNVFSEPYRMKIWPDALMLNDAARFG